MDRDETITAAAELGPGEHAAFFFSDNAERFAVAIPYILRGIEAGERCIYIADENSVFQILEEFRRTGLDVDGATARGSLSVVTKHDSYLRHGLFEPKRMIQDFDRDVRLALQRGFSGLRATAEMTWALDLPSALTQLCEYESALLRRWPNYLAGLCQYNETIFSESAVEKMVTCHCTYVRRGKIVRHRGCEVAA